MVRPDCHGGCCPEEGLPLPSPADVPAVAAFVRAGVAPLATRQALVEGVVPPRDEARALAVGRQLEALDRTVWLDHVEDTVAGWSRVLDPRADAIAVSDLGDEEIALVTTSLADVTWRDTLMAVLCPGVMPTTTQQSPVIGAALRAAMHCPWVDGEHMSDGEDMPDGEQGEHHELVLTVRARLVELSRLVLVTASPPVLTLVAHLAWWAGDGTVTGVCLERALEIDPDYRLADLMMRLLTAGVRPWSDSGGGPEGPDTGEEAGWAGSAA